MTKTTYPMGRWVEIVRDGRGLVIQEVVGYAYVDVYETAFDYDANGNLIWQRNPDGTEYEWEYDNFDRVIKVPYIAFHTSVTFYRWSNSPGLARNAILAATIRLRSRYVEPGIKW